MGRNGTVHFSCASVHSLELYIIIWV